MHQLTQWGTPLQGNNGIPLFHHRDSMPMKAAWQAEFQEISLFVVSSTHREDFVVSPLLVQLQIKQSSSRAVRKASRRPLPAWLSLKTEGVG